MINRPRLIFLSVIVSFCLVATSTTYLSYRHAIGQAEQATLMRLKGITNSLALHLDGDAHEALLRRYPNMDDIRGAEEDSLYASLHRTLADNYVANMLHSPVYTLVFDSLGQEFAFGVTSATQPYFRHPYNSPSPLLVQQRLEGGMLPMYHDEFGIWLSAFSPIKNRAGQVVGLVQADEHFEAFIVNARRDALRNVALILGIMGGLLLVLTRIIQPMLAREQRDRRQLEAAHARISDLDQFRKEMLANLSHDLRTPIANVLGYADTLATPTVPYSADEQRRFVGIIAAEARRLDRMIADLFDLTRLEMDQIRLEKEPVNFSELAQDNLYKYTVSAQARRIRLQTEIAAALPLVSADIRLFDRVIQNLLDNAFKYANDGGLVMITIFEEENWLHFKVCNTGTPPDAAHLPHIFERYFRSSNHDADSTGLGLAIVKKTVDLHGGRVWAEVNGDLTTFRFALAL